MRVEVLGTRGHIEVSAPGHQLHAGILIGDVLFDMGERQYLDRRPRAAFLTHLHEDHAFFVNEPDAPLDLPVYAPQPWDGRELRVIRSTVEVEGMRVTPVPTNHSAGVRSCAYLIEKDLGRILYTGDLISVQERFRERIPDLDLVIADGSFIRHGGLVRFDPQTGRPHGHTGIPDLVEYFSPFTPRILFTHFGSWFFHDIPAAVGKIEALSGSTKVEAAFDGMVLEVGP
jgi:glyoxylase-like metal-dependent hydrolase (beta-lactamase superfamily II)